MSVNVLERILVRLLPAAVLAPAGSLVDAWEAAAPPRPADGDRWSLRRAAPLEQDSMELLPVQAALDAAPLPAVDLASLLDAAHQAGADIALAAACPVPGDDDDDSVTVVAVDGRQADADHCAAVACPVPDDDAELHDGMGAADGTQIGEGKAVGNPGQDDTDDAPDATKSPLAPHLGAAPTPQVLPVLSAVQGLRKDLSAGSGLLAVLIQTIVLLKAVPGSLGRFVRSWHLPLLPRAPHVASREIFPLPWLEDRRAPRGRARERAGRSHSQVARQLANLWIAVLNYMHWGPHFGICQSRPSTAQARAQHSLLDRAHGFLRRCPVGAAGGDAINSMLRVAADGYSSNAGVLPLGLRAGVPDTAAVVDTAAVLRHFDPIVAEQCENPAALLLPLAEWPEKKPMGLQATRPELCAARRQGCVCRAHGVGWRGRCGMRWRPGG